MCVCYLSFRKDTSGFFAFPVNDVIAPGYSSIITNPMDFSTMKYKLDTHVYTSLEEFRVSLKNTAALGGFSRMGRGLGGLTCMV